MTNSKWEKSQRHIKWKTLKDFLKKFTSANDVCSHSFFPFLPIIVKKLTQNSIFYMYL